ncbi:response regulator [Candidatus Woesearchaeota archaeon]|nr:response regulator [Candidatus Woesearchaeota archaeon]
MTTILIVDDEPHMVELEKGILETNNYTVLSATSGEEALKVLEKQTPDLTILDMMMPGMSGRELAEKIRANTKTKNLKIIFVTVARFSEIGKELLNDLSVLDYITKPFDNQDFLKRVKKALAK